jgi:hypothetical protein
MDIYHYCAPIHKLLAWIFGLIVVLIHATYTPLNGLNGTPLSYDTFVA